MKTLSCDVNNEIVIKNSRFICILRKLDSPDINDILDIIKKQYPKATHYCYAYIYDDLKYCSDDNEPSNTAGAPILNVIEKEELNHVIAVVVRYFGGTKLGAGGLIRAYTKSVTETLKKAFFIFMEEGFKISIVFDYSSEKMINYILDNMIIINKTFDSNIKYEAIVNKDVLDKLEKYNPVILEKTYIEVRK